MRLVVFCAFALLLAACAAAPASDAPIPVEPDGGIGDTPPDHHHDMSPLPVNLITFEAGACFGACPTFELTLPSQGPAIYDGGRFSRLKGPLLVHLPRETYLELETILLEGGVTGMDADYSGENCPMMATDHPSYTVHLQVGRIDKRVHFYAGCHGVEDYDRINAMFEAFLNHPAIKDLWEPVK